MNGDEPIESVRVLADEHSLNGGFHSFEAAKINIIASPISLVSEHVRDAFNSSDDRGSRPMAGCDEILAYKGRVKFQALNQPSKDPFPLLQSRESLSFNTGLGLCLHNVGKRPFAIHNCTSPSVSNEKLAVKFLNRLRTLDT